MGRKEQQIFALPLAEPASCTILTQASSMANFQRKPARIYALRWRDGIISVPGEGLARRQLVVLTLGALGLTEVQRAKMLDLSLDTVVTIRQQILRRLGATTLPQAIGHAFTAHNIFRVERALTLPPPGLSDIQKKVLESRIHCQTIEEIADELTIGFRAVKYSLATAGRVLGTTKAPHTVFAAYASGVLPSSPPSDPQLTALALKLEPPPSSPEELQVSP